MSTEDKISSDGLADLIGRVRVSFGGFEDADALIAEAERFAARLAEVEAERDAVDAALREFGIEYPLGARGVRDIAAMASGRLEDLRTAEAELEAARPVVEAAAAYIAAERATTVADVEELTPAERERDMAWDVLAWSVDLYRSATTRNLDSDAPDPSLAAETLPTTEEKP